MKSVWRQADGSVSVVTVVLLGITLAITMAVIEREWKTHLLRLAQEMADFAAEAGAQFWEEHTRVTIERWQWQTRWRQICRTEFDLAGRPYLECDWEPYRVKVWSFPAVEERAAVLLHSWPAVLGCGRDPSTEWICVDTPQVIGRRLEFLDSAAPAARATFTANWADRDSGHLIWLVATPHAAARSLIVQAVIRLQPLVLPGLGSQEMLVTGRSVVQLAPIQF